MSKKEELQLEKIRHSISHLMTMAVLELYPKTGLGVGTPIEDGFYQDYDLPKKISDDILPKLEKRVKELVKEGIDFTQTEVSFADALKFYKDDPYKTELVNDVKKKGEKSVFFFDSGSLHNLCKGPHVKNTREIDPKAFKLTKIAGAYWRGDEKNKMLTRIYGVAFASKKELDKYLKMMEEAEKRNHVKIGRQLDLFSIHEDGPGFPFFHHKGLVIWQELMKYWREEHNQEGYLEVTTPILLNKKLWEQSGHWEHFRENMYFTKIDDKDYAVKPMNCPGGMLIYKANRHSYRELPLKMAEVGLVHRHELSGTLNGLFRVRAFKQEDAHVFCTEEQVKEEVIKIIKLTDRIYKTFGLGYHMELSTKPEKAIGTAKMWKTAEIALEEALKEVKADYILNPGDGAFYGPKIDFHIKDAIGRTWQCGTIQLDFAMPEKFKLKYTGSDGKEHKPVMLHRTIYGGIERFYGILIEHYAGAFPVWLSPVQIKIISVGEKHVKYAQKLAKEFKDDYSFRVEVDDSDETVGNKIRKAIGEKALYVLVAGDKEMKSGKLAVRDRGKDKVREIDKKKFVKEVQEKIKKKK